jgi:predicted permease
MISRFDVSNAFSRIFSDLKYSLIIMAAMSFGIGVALFLFSQVYARNYAVLPFKDSERLVYISRLEQDFVRTNGGLHNYDVNYFEKRQTSLNDFAAYENRSFTLSTTTVTKQVRGVATSSSFFKVTGIQPLMGRYILSSDDVEGTGSVAVIGYDLWKEVFQGSETAVGSLIKIDGLPITVVGVMPKGFEFPLNHGLWLSYRPPNLATPDGEGWNSVIGKLKDGVSLANAKEEFKNLASGIQSDFPQLYAEKSVAVHYYAKAFVANTLLLIKMMSVAALAILAMSLLSVVSLIVVRMLENSKQIAIKNAIGIPRNRIVVGPLLESFVLCALSCILAVYVSQIALMLSAGYIIGGSDPFWWSLVPIGKIWLAAILASTLAWLLTGLLPTYLAFKKLNLSALSGGKKGGVGGKIGPLMSVFVSLQVSCAFVLMVFTGVCIASFYKVIKADYGVNPRNFLTAWVQPAASLYPDLKNRIQYFQKLSQESMTLSDVKDVAFASALPGSLSYLSTYNGLDNDLSVNGASPQVIEIPISANFFSVFDVPLVEGRAFIAADDESSNQVVIVTKKIAKRISPNSSAVGKRLHLNPERNGPILTIVGVVPDLIYGSPVSFGVQFDNIYRPMTQVMPAWSGMVLAVKTKDNPYNLVQDLNQIARRVDPQVALTGVESYQDGLEANGWEFIALIYNFMPAAVLAFIMSAFGTYAIAARIVFQRTNDIGVMKAIGISDLNITKMLMFDMAKKLVVGLLFGAILFAAFIPNIISQLLVLEYGTLALIAMFVALALSVVFSVASYLPLAMIGRMNAITAINNSCG